MKQYTEAGVVDSKGLYCLSVCGFMHVNRLCVECVVYRLYRNDCIDPNVQITFKRCTFLHAHNMYLELNKRNAVHINSQGCALMALIEMFFYMLTYVNRLKYLKVINRK